MKITSVYKICNLDMTTRNLSCSQGVEIQSRGDIVTGWMKQNRETTNSLCENWILLRLVDTKFFDSWLKIRLLIFEQIEVKFINFNTNKQQFLLMQTLILENYKSVFSSIKGLLTVIAEYLGARRETIMQIISKALYLNTF